MKKENGRGSDFSNKLDVRLLPSQRARPHTTVKQARNLCNRRNNVCLLPPSSQLQQDQPSPAGPGGAKPSDPNSPLPTCVGPAPQWLGTRLGLGYRAARARRACEETGTEASDPVLSKLPASESAPILRPHSRRRSAPLLRQQPLHGPRPCEHFAQAFSSSASVTPGPTFWEKVCTTPPGRTSNATVVGSDTASAGLSATAARSSVAHKPAPPPPSLLPLGAAMLGSGPQD